LNEASEGNKRLGTALILGTMGNFACNDGGPQRTLRSIVGWLHGRVVEKAEHPPSIVLSANTIQQSLVVIILQDSVPHMPGKLAFDSLRLTLQVYGLAVPMGVPDLESLLQQPLESLAELSRPPTLGFHYIADVTNQMG
jgi:hypothetical protein